MTTVDLRGATVSVYDDVGDRVELLVRPTSWEADGWDPSVIAWTVDSDLDGWIATPVVADSDGTPWLQLVLPAAATAVAGRYGFAVYGDDEQTLLRRSTLVLEGR